MGNEKTWQDILRYERLHAKECATPKSWLLGLTGRTQPFDRHDWHVDRCGTSVRYVVDFYDGKSAPDDPRVAIHIDARPEVSFGGIADRFRIWASDLNIF